MKSSKELISLIKSPSKEEEKLITRAFDYSQKIHVKQLRYSGEPYFNHSYETAKNLALLGMSSVIVVAGLLHDVIEDANAQEEEIKKEFGEEILFLINGVTKLGKIRFKGLKRHVESLRKLFIASSQDIRVIIIKLADRIHNMETLQYVPKEKQLRIATETLEIFAPLAYRLGMGILNRRLEDLSFPYVYPKEYEKIKVIIKERNSEDIESLKKVSRTIIKKLAKEGITNIETSYRKKGLHSLYRKLERKDWDVNKIYDILALRIIVPTISDCYKALGIIHSFRRPMPGRIKDYIAFPKPNGYQSLHTTIFTRFGNVIEIQLRTAEMHRKAEYGIASHLLYKSSKTNNGGNHSYNIWIKKILPNIHKLDKDEGKEILTPDSPSWIKKMVDSQNSIHAKEFIEELKKDFFEHRIFIFTPKGDVIDLPIDSNPIDFAFAIHSDIGNHMSGAKVHGKLVSLDTKLKNGDIVEIIINKKITPTNKWLNIAKTAEAKRHIKSCLKKQREKEKPN